MKKIILILTCCFLTLFSFSQTIPTLGVGLETLTLNKGSIDVEVLTKIIMQKQKELKNEALKRFMLKMFPETNYTTRYYVHNCLNILLNEKNPQVIEKEIMELTTNYAIALGATKAIEKLNNDAFKYEIVNKKEETKSTIESKKDSYEVKIEKLRNSKLKSNKIKNLITKIDSIKKRLDKAIEKKDYHKSKKLNNKYKRKKNKLTRLKMKNNIVSNQSNSISDTDIKEINFGIKLDLVSLALSENELIRKKGFFKNKIDFREEIHYQTVGLDEKNILKITKKIDSLIKPYIENYDIIKAYINDFEINNLDKDKKSIVNISNQLIDVYFKQFNLSDTELTTIGLASIIEEAKNLKDALSLKNNIEYLVELNIKELNNTNPTFENTYLEIGNTINKINPAIAKYNEIALLIEKSQINNPKIKLPKLEIKEYKIEDYFENKNNLKTDFNNIENLKIAISNLNEKLKQYPDIIDATENVKIKNDIAELEKKIDNLNIKNLPKGINNLNEVIKTLQKGKNSIESIRDLLLTENDTRIKDLKKIILKSDVFFNEFLKKMINNIEKNSKINNTLKPEEKLIITSTLSDLYNKLNYIKNNKNINLEDINFIENVILKRVFEAKLLDNLETKSNYDEIINDIKNITPLLKMKIVIDKGLDIKYSKEVVSLFEFIGNLNKLDKAETYTSIIDLLRENSETIIDDLPEGKFKEGYLIFINGMKKYTLINTNTDVKKEYIEIDIVSFLNDLQQYYNRNNPSSFSLYLSMGLNQNVFIDDFTFPDNVEQINSIGFASEKIGIKYKLYDFKNYNSYENAIKSDVYLNKRDPFINEWYIISYGSGLLYSLANTSTNQNFDFAHIGFGTGIRFYNALDLNLTLGLPFVKNENFGNNGFIGLGLDIPLGEYLEGLGNK